MTLRLSLLTPCRAKPRGFLEQRKSSEDNKLRGRVSKMREQHIECFILTQVPCPKIWMQNMNTIWVRVKDTPYMLQLLNMTGF